MRQCVVAPLESEYLIDEKNARKGEDQTQTRRRGVEVLVRAVESRDHTTGVRFVDREDMQQILMGLPTGHAQLVKR